MPAASAGCCIARPSPASTSAVTPRTSWLAVVPSVPAPSSVPFPGTPSRRSSGRPAALSAILDAAAHTDASPIVTVNLWFDRVVTDQMFIGLPGRTMQWVFDKRTVFSSRHRTCRSCRAALPASSDAATRISSTWPSTKYTDALPAARSAIMTRGVVVREKRATFSVAPGQPPRPSIKTSVPGLFLAGDWIDTGLPATIEGAVVSGHRAAAAVMDVVR